MNRKSFPILVLVFAIISLISGGAWIVQSIQFKQNCGGHLRRAANANTIQLASQELKTALTYLESHKLTSGSTHVIYATPDNDIEYWYNNIKAAYDELQGIPPSSSLQERTNVLMKLRESLMGHSKDGDHVILPPRIAIYPNQGLILLGTLIGIIFVGIWSKKK